MSGSPTRKRKLTSEHQESDLMKFLRKKVRGDEAPIIALPSRTHVWGSPSGSISGYAINEPLSNICLPPPVKNSYNLCELCYIQKNEENISDSSEECVRNWLNIQLKEEFQECNYQNQFQEVNCFKPLASYLSSNTIKPDVFFFKNDIPLLLCEVHSSSSYRADIQKCLISLVYQLRLLRLCDTRINTVCGFVFPNMEQKKLVTMVEVKWDKLAFRAEYTYLEKELVVDAVRIVMKSQIGFSKIKQGTANYFMALSPHELAELEKELVTTKLIQVESKYSILMKDEWYYYKIVPSIKAESNLKGFSFLNLWNQSKSTVESISYLTLPIGFTLVYGVTIFKFESHPHHFETWQDIKRCLVPIVTEANEALKQLHALGHAHTDIRFPNFCISKEYHLKLIDFDRAMPLSNTPSPNPSFLYSSPKEASNPACFLDYKQLGCLILQIQDTIYDDMDLIISDEDKIKHQHPFLSNLIFNGAFDESLFHTWKQDQKFSDETFIAVFNTSIESKTE